MLNNSLNIGLLKLLLVNKKTFICRIEEMSYPRVHTAIICES